LPLLSPNPRIIVFDYDGVLADTEPLHWASWKTLLAPYNIELTWEKYCLHCRGVADVRMAEALKNVTGHPPPAADLAPNLARRKEEVFELSLARSPIPAATITMLRELTPYRLGLVTSAEHSEIEPVLRAANILDLFEASVFAGDSARPKPAPDPYLTIASRMGATGVAFEDSEPGLVSASSAGFAVVRVNHPHDLPEMVRTLLLARTKSARA